MRKLFLQGFIIIASFFAIWLLLSRVDWMTLLKVDRNTKKTEEKLGKMFFDVFSKIDAEIDSGFVKVSVDSIVKTICNRNGIDTENIKVHILSNNEVNAFALPDGHIVIYTGLIEVAFDQDELGGVICHEMAHIELDHVMKKLIREVGLSVLFSSTTGTNNPEMIKEAAKMLSSSSFDRNMEKEADLKAVDYLMIAGIDPEPFADFLFRLKNIKNDGNGYPSWISSHPDPEERGRYIIDYSKGKEPGFEHILKDGTWNKIRDILNE